MKNLLKSIIKFTKNTIFAIILVFFVAFMVNNRQKTTFELFPLPISIETNLFIIMIGCFLLGIIATLLILSKFFIKNTILSKKYDNLKKNSHKNS